MLELGEVVRFLTVEVVQVVVAPEAVLLGDVAVVQLVEFLDRLEEGALVGSGAKIFSLNYN